MKFRDFLWGVSNKLAFTDEDVERRLLDNLEAWTEEERREVHDALKKHRPKLASKLASSFPAPQAAP